MNLSGESEEPTKPGTVVRVNTPLSKYPEVWVADHINGGVWYPDSSSWAQGVRGPFKDGGAYFQDLTTRGTVTLLVAAPREAYEAGWRAACGAMRQAAEELEGECQDDLRNEKARGS